MANDFNPLSGPRIGTGPLDPSKLPTPAAPQAGPAAAAAPAGPAPVKDRVHTGPLAQQAVSAAVTAGAKAAPAASGMGEVQVPRTKAMSPTGRLKSAALMLGELGVVGTLTQVAVAFSRTTFNPTELASSLGTFASNLNDVGEKLNAIPGVGAALAPFGGVGGIVTGVNNLKTEIASVREDGLNLGNGLGAAAAAARLVGGVAMALSPFCAPLAAVGGSITMAGAAFELGKLGWEQRGAIQAGAEKTGQAIGGAVRTIGKQSEDVARLISNNGAAAVRDQPGAFSWMTG